MNEIENELEEVNVFNFDDEEIEKKIEKNCEKLDEHPEENLKDYLFKGIDKKHITEGLVNKTLEIYNVFNIEEEVKGIDVLKSIFSEVLNFSKFNFSQRLNDFFDYILSIPNLKFEYLTTAVKIKVKDLGEKNHKDVIFFWKESIAEQQLKEENIKISEQMKDCLRLLLEHNFNLNEINYIFHLFKKVICNNNIAQFDIIQSLISTLILYPNFLKERDEEKRKKKEEELSKFFDEYLIKVNNNYIFDEKKNTALDFYLKISSDENYSESSELTVQEIFQILKMNNPGITDEHINDINAHLEIAHSMINNLIYRTYDKAKFQKWAKDELPKLKQNYPRKVTGSILGMISLAIKKTRGYYLRNTQLIAVLLFIYKDRKHGLIEEISTGEGKSCIIGSLSIYYALMGLYVDIISSSYTLAQRDSEEFKELYSYFNLTTDYPCDSQQGPYQVNILYGTFLEFEGDYLREKTSDMVIRKERTYNVIIIDEVDNLFIDNILGSTRLTNSSLGFKFLIPFYLTIYLYFELIDYFFLLHFKVCLDNNVENQERKKKFESVIKNPKERKKEMLKIIKGNLEEILKYQSSNINKDKKDDNNNIAPEVEQKIEKIVKAGDDFFDFIANLGKFMEYPEFLKSFIEAESNWWCDSAYDAKNLMEIDRDYVEIINKSGNRDIAPVDRTNTGEIELNTVYGEGLHQMLEIKHKLRVKDETLVHTFLSHITFFQEYKNDNEFLFFGLTGTIGDEATQEIYGNQYFDSKLLFIPQYKKKRFIELPPILVDIKDHLFIICKDILINFYKGRKILVICNSIKEAKIIEDELKHRIKLEEIGLDNNLVKNEDYKNSIILYTRSDTEKTNIKQKNKKIILSTNLGGRGTDIQTSPEEEKNGGLHVILTYMPRNYRVLKQAFGRTSREGKKGTGQIILKNTGYKSYLDVKQEMENSEKEEIKYIQKKLRVLLYKDKLFKKFLNIIKDADFNGYLIEDINERWANFLRINVTSSGDELKIDEIDEKFKIFEKQVSSMLKEKEIYKQFENPFYQMKEGLRLYRKYEKELMQYYDFHVERKKFYFSQPYIKAIIRILNPAKYEEKFFKKIKDYFDESITRIKLLIEENLDPVLFSFDQWEGALINLESALKTNENFKFFDDMERPFSDKCFITSDLYRQYTNIKKICEKIIDRIEENKKFMDLFWEEYKKDDTCSIFVTEEDLEDGLALNEEQLKEKAFFSDAAFNIVFKFSIRRKKRYFEAILWILGFLGVIAFIAGFIGGAVAAIAAVGFFAYPAYDFISNYRRGLEVGSNSLFGNILYSILKSLNKDRKHKNAEIVKNPHPEDDLIKSSKNILLENIMYNIEINFEKIKKSSATDILNFLIFVDCYFSVDIWTEKIKKIFEDNFEIYKKGFIENDFFKSPITDETFDMHLSSYNSLFDAYLVKCISEINKLGNPKKYNKKDGLNCLEHFIIDLNSENINEDISNITVTKMLEYNLISEDGTINKKFFEDCFKDKKGKNLEQKIKIHINNKLRKENPIKKINNIKDFKIQGFEIPLIDSSFIDLANFYQINNYDIQHQLEKDFSLHIINYFKQIIIRLLNMDQIILNNFYNFTLNFIKNMIKNLLQEKLFSKYNKRTMENVIESELSKEERVEFNKLIKEATENADILMGKKK